MKKKFLLLLFVGAMFLLTACNSSEETTSEEESTTESSFQGGDISEVGITDNVQSISIYTKNDCIDIDIDISSEDGQSIISYVNEILTSEESFNGITEGVCYITEIGEQTSNLPYGASYLVIFLNERQDYTIKINDSEGNEIEQDRKVYAMSFDLESLESFFSSETEVSTEYSLLNSYGMNSSEETDELETLISELLSK